MAIRALNPLAPFWYTPRAEADAERPTKFKIRGLNGAEAGYVTPELITDPEARTVASITGKGVDLALKYGLADWENFDNDAGPVAFSPLNFSLIPHLVRVELAWKILAASYAEPAEKKT